MGMATGTNEAQDAEAVADEGATYEVDQGTAIVSVDRTGALYAAVVTCLKFRTKSIHERIKQGF